MVATLRAATGVVLAQRGQCQCLAIAWVRSGLLAGCGRIISTEIECFKNRLHLPAITGDEPSFTYPGTRVCAGRPKAGQSDYLWPVLPG